MKLNCPECNTPVPAEKINIQQMVAVCPACGTVFPFETPQTKSKRRKVHQPQNLELQETDQSLTMAFRTNFRLLQNQSFLASSSMSLGVTLLTLIMTTTFLEGENSIALPAVFALMTLACYYWTVLIAYNKTHIEMDDEKISVSRKPLPVLFEEKNDVSLAGVSVIRYEETPISKKEGYDLPRYNVWAETADGSRRIIVRDVIEDYAVFIAQRLNEQLAVNMDPDIDMDVSHLIDEDRDADIEDDSTRDAMIQTANQQRRSS